MNSLVKNLTTKLALFGLLFIFVGCGNSGGSADQDSSFVFTGATTDVAQVGSVTANFVTPQAALEVPGATVTLAFRFFTEQNANGVFFQEERVDFASSVTIDGVGVNARSVQVLARDGDGRILLRATVNFELASGGNTVLDFAGAQIEVPTPDVLTVTPSSATIQAGEMLELSALVFDQFGQSFATEAGDVSWTVSNGTAVTVDATTGVVTGVLIGDAAVSGTISGVVGRATITVGAGNAPVLTLDGGQLALNTGGAVEQAFPTATAESSLANLAGGTLTVGAATGLNENVTVTLPTTPNIGTIQNNNTSNVTVTLSADATPANIQTVLQGVTIAATGAGSGQLQVELSDGLQSDMESRTFAATGINQIANGGFQDISGDAGATEFLVGDDGSSPPLSLPFDFTLYGVDFSTFVANDNGNVSLTPFSTFINVTFPSAGNPALIAPHWDDLNFVFVAPGGGDSIFFLVTGTSPERRAIVQWENYQRLGSTSRETFQVVFVENGNLLEFHYEATDDGGEGATIGVQSNAGTEFFLFSFDTPGSVTAGLSLEIFAP